MEQSITEHPGIQGTPVLRTHTTRILKNTSFDHIFLLFAAMCLFLGACTSKTVLIANFKNDTIGSPPQTAQPTGTVTLQPGPGTISVVAAPKPDLPTNNWCRITHPGGPVDQTKLIGNFTEFGIGEYGILASLHIPKDADVVTVGFEASSQSPLPFGQFMHLDFMPEGDVRVDDTNVRFGQFPRDANFVLSVSMKITATGATADVTLLGEGASGNKVIPVSSNVFPLAKQFGAVAFEVGFQHKATFFVDDVIVTRKNP